MCDVRVALRYLATVLVLAFATSSCLISGDGFGGKLCKKNEDCPGIAGYLCVAPDTWPQRGCGEGEEGCVCEVKFPPDPGGIGLDGGGPVIPDAGPPPDYCAEIKPIIDLKCLSTCHSDQMGYPGSPPDFRLDYWEPGPQHAKPDGGPGLPGVKAKVIRMQARINENTMPPFDYPLKISKEDRDLFNRWVNRFGYPLGDGGCTVSGTVTPMDAGTVMDAGVRPDAGAPVSFSTQVVPIFTQRCGPCHTTNATPSGNLSLTAANAYNALVGVDVRAACAPVGTPRKRVLANAPNMSQLWLKIRNDANRCGNSMPNGQMPLLQMAPAQADIIDRWIRQGAPNN